MVAHRPEGVKTAGKEIGIKKKKHARQEKKKCLPIGTCGQIRTRAQHEEEDEEEEGSFSNLEPKSSKLKVHPESV